MAIYRGPGGSGDATADSSSEALLVRELATEVQADADAAAASATAASTSATSANNSASSASTSATNASNSASAASTSATNAASSASSASTSASTATTKASEASTSATNAANSASAASTSASNASASETSAASSASSASSSATSATASASSASTSASTATTKASEASTSATNAASSASSASTSASTATTQAGIATTKASEASTSATNATSSASSASTSATNAAASATTASTQASNASTSATNAANSASSASTSATNASNSASSAATSATNAANSATTAASFTPSQTGNSGKYLTTDGTATSWATVSSNQWALSGSDIYYNTGNVGIGNSSPAFNLDVAGTISNVANTIYSNTTSGSNFYLRHSRGTSVGTNTVVQTNDTLGTVVFSGVAPDGSYAGSASIRGAVDNTPSGNTCPGRLLFSTSPTGSSSPVERMRIDSAGNVGIGVTPSAWSGYTALQTLRTSVAGDSSGSAYFSANWYNNAGDKYIANGYATQYVQYSGVHAWKTAASGTAGNAITFTQAMTLDASGNLGVGTSSPSTFGALAVVGNTYCIGGATSTSQLKLGYTDGTSYWDIGRDNVTTGDFLFKNGTTERMRISAAGVVTSGLGGMQVISGTAVTASGTSVSFTGIPSWAKKITVMFSGLSTSGTSNIQIQLGTGSTTYTTSGYASTCQDTVAGTATSGFLVSNSVAAANTRSGATVISNLTSNTWVNSGVVSRTDAAVGGYCSGTVSLGAALTAIRITMVNGTDTFDAGTINILYE